MEFRDLKAQYQALKSDIDTAIQKVINHSNFISGEPVHELEKELENYTNMKYCITCANGTDALTLAMMALHIGEGDAVFVPDFTFFSSGEIVSFANATPIFVDVDIDTFNISAVELEKAIKQIFAEGKLKPRAIIAVDLFGQPANYDKIRALADKYSLVLIEDGAQGFGGRIGNKAACSFGDIATTSFFPAKPLGCYGDGGAVFTNDDSMAEYLRSICVHGKGSNKYDNIRIGMNSRLDTLQAAILLPKLNALKNYELDAVNKSANYYTEHLKNLVKTPVVLPGFYSSWAQYTITLSNLEERNGLQSFLKTKGIPTMVYYQKPMHRQEAFDKSLYADESFHNTNTLCDTVLSLPMHPYLTIDIQDQIISCIQSYLK